MTQQAWHTLLGGVAMIPRVLRLHPKTYRRLIALRKEAERDGAYRVAKRMQAVVLNSEGRTSGYWWKKRLWENTAARFVEVQVAAAPANLPSDARIEVRLQNGRSLMVGRGFDPEHVRGLLAVVEAAG